MLASRAFRTLTALVAALVLVGGPTRPARAEITKPAEQIVARYLEAAGGAALLRSTKSTYTRATIEAFGLKGTTQVWARQPDDRATRTQIGPFKLSGGTDGKGAWKIDPSGNLAVLDGKDLDEARAESYFENERWQQPDQGGGRIAVVKDPTADADHVVLEVTPPVGRPRRMFFSTRTGLIDKIVGHEDQQEVVSTFSDPRKVGGRVISFHTLTQITGMPANDLTLNIDSVLVDVPIADAVFALPNEEPVEVVRFLKTPGTARIPFEYLARHVWLKASINGQPPADFIFDTGASVTVIDSAYAVKIGLKSEGKLHSQGAGASGSAAFSQIDRLRVEAPDGDGVEMKDQKVAVLSVNPFLAPFFWRECAGIIGYDFITRFVDEIRFDDAVIVLHDPKTFTYAGKGAAIPMQLAGTVPVVSMKLDERYQGLFRLDVGSSSTVDLHTPFVERNDIAKAAGRGIPVVGGGFGGSFTSTLVRMHKLELGPYSWTDPLATLSSTTSGALASEDYAGNVGNQILERFTCTFDYDRRLVYLEPGRRYGDRDRFSHTGVQLGRFGSTVRALQVLDGSPAQKAGIHEGDEIVAIDGKPVLSYGVGELRTRVDEGPVGTKVVYDLRRGGKRKKATVKLAEML